MPRRLTASALGYYALADLIPFYAVYAVLFADHGLSTGQISALFVIWSVVAFVVEVPSGAWADTVSRRALLVASSLLYAGCFASWLLVPSFVGFAAGFVLWAVSGSLMSGTFQALLYDELVAVGGQQQYARLMGLAESLAMACVLVSSLAAAPLMAVGGYALVGWVSVGVALLQGVLALALPRATQVARADELPDDEHGSLLHRYLRMLGSGLRESASHRAVRRCLLLVAMLTGLLAFDEYFPLLAVEHGATVEQVPLLVSVVVVCQLVGTALAGRTARIGAGAMGAALVAAGALLATGALSPLPWGFLLLGVGYGIVGNAIIVSDARLQHAIEGRARATVTSVSGFGSEVVAVALYLGFAAGSAVLPLAATTAVVACVLLPLGVAARRWLPADTGEPVGSLER